MTDCISEWDDESEEEYEDQERIRFLRSFIETSQAKLLEITQGGVVQYAMTTGDHSQSATRQRMAELTKEIRDARNEIAAIRAKYRGGIGVLVPST